MYWFHGATSMRHLSRINQSVVALACILTLYVFLNGLVYLYVIALAFTGQIIYTSFRPFGPESKYKTQQETTEQLHDQINGLDDTIKAQRSVIEVLIEVNTKLRERTTERNTP